MVLRLKEPADLADPRRESPGPWSRSLTSMATATWMPRKERRRDRKLQKVQGEDRLDSAALDALGQPRCSQLPDPRFEHKMPD